MRCEIPVCGASEPARTEKKEAAVRFAESDFVSAMLFGRRRGRKERKAHASFTLGSESSLQQVSAVVTSFPNQSFAARLFPATPPPPNQAPEPTAGLRPSFLD